MTHSMYLFSRILPASVLLIILILTGCSDGESDNNPGPASSILKGTISGDRILVNSSASVDYYIEDIVDVNARLTIEPGTVILAKAGSGLRFSGNAAALVAVGTSEKPISIRSESGQKGGWLGIILDNSNNPLNEMAHVEIADGGSGSFDGDGSRKGLVQVSGTTQLKMHHCTLSNSASAGFLENPSSSLTLNMFESNTFRNHTGYPVYVYGETARDLGTGHTFTGNTENYIALKERSYLTGTHVWKKQPVPYLWTASDNLVAGYYSDNCFLTLEAGVQLLMAPGTALVVGDNANQNSTLKIQGTAADPVVVRGESPVRGAWKGLFIKTPQAGNQISFATIADGGSAAQGGGRANVVLASDARVSFNQVILSNSAGCGYSYNSADPPGNISATGMSYSNNALGNVCTY